MLGRRIWGGGISGRRRDLVGGICAGRGGFVEGREFELGGGDLYWKERNFCLIILACKGRKCED